MCVSIKAKNKITKLNLVSRLIFPLENLKLCTHVTIGSKLMMIKSFLKKEKIM